MKIITFDNENSNETYIKIEIPLELNLPEKLSETECVEIARQCLTNHTGTVFEHLNKLTELVENEGIDRIAYLEMVNFLSTIGKGLANASESVEMATRRHGRIADAMNLEVTQ